MRKKLINSAISILVFLSMNGISILAMEKPQNNIAQETGEIKNGSILLQELLMSHQVLATSPQSSKVNRQIPGSIVLINEKKYEIISFSFEDTNDIQLEETFEEYVKKNRLFSMKSKIISPAKNIIYEFFDSNQANLEDGIYFSIFLRQINS